MTRASVSLVLGFSFALAACGETSLHRTGQRFPPRPPTCDFQVLTATPNGGHVEVGTVDVEPGGWGQNTFTQLGAFKREIAPAVCKAGGDVAIASANGFGMYIKATILKRVDTPSSTTSVTSAGSAGGCSFDTQCKGDRVCVQGACVEPTK